jgi:hypothetical protein
MSFERGGKTNYEQQKRKQSRIRKKWQKVI